MNKLFIIGLPRTGTTSVSAALLEFGFKVAHTAYTQQTFALADVLADTPCFCDYPQLDNLFPDSRFIYLDRDLETWVPSIQVLLSKISKYLQPDSHFNPIIKRCFNQTFQLLDTIDPMSAAHLSHCYQQHQQAVFDYFSRRNDFLSIEVSQTGSLSQLLEFLGRSINKGQSFPHLNAGRMITAWRDIKHPNIISSNASGTEGRKYFGFAE